MKFKLALCRFIFFPRRKADIVARLLKTERPNMKRKQVEEEEEMGKTKSKSNGDITLLF